MSLRRHNLTQLVQNSLDLAGRNAYTAVGRKGHVLGLHVTAQTQFIIQMAIYVGGVKWMDILLGQGSKQGEIVDVDSGCGRYS